MRDDTVHATDLTVAGLIDLLSDHEPDTPVRLAVQPSWPFTHTLAPVAALDPTDGAVYLAAGEQLSYLPDSARRALTDAGDPRWTTRS